MMTTTNTAIVPAPDFCGSNRKPGKCAACSGHVAAGEGNLFRSALTRRFVVYHANGCAAPAAK